MDRLLIDIPDAFETERLIVRCPRPGDGRLVYAGTFFRNGCNRCQPIAPDFDARAARHSPRCAYFSPSRAIRRKEASNLQTRGTVFSK